MNKAIAAILCLALVACSYDPMPKRLAVADKVAVKGGMTRAVVDTDGFSIMSYKRIAEKNRPINVYIEGDGFAWAAAGRLSVNPSPKNPVALKLASMDRSSNVAYLARPCQYVNLASSKLCQRKYWDGSKYSKEVIDSLTQAIDKIKSSDEQKINLIGFSGGGGIVVILGAIRDDVASIRTVAGNLNHVAFNSYHGVSQLNDSLNAADFAHMIKNIPQMYISGSDDEVVPPFLAADFAKRVDSSNGCVKLKTLPNVTHHKGWQAYWNDIITKPLKCIDKNKI